MADRIGKHSKSSKEAGSSMSWTAWAQKYGSKVLNSSDADDVGGSTKNYFEKKIARTDLPMYGVCPAKNQLCLIVCSHCGKSITPHGLLRHYEMRHNYRPSYGSISEPLASSNCPSVPSTSTPRNMPSVSTSERRSSVSSVDSISPPPSPQQPPSLNFADSPAIVLTDRCARICYTLPLERWSGKRKRQDESPAAGSKHAKQSAKQRWVDGFGQVDGKAETTSVTSEDVRPSILKSPASRSPIASAKPALAIASSSRSASGTVDSIKSVPVSSVGKTANSRNNKSVSNFAFQAASADLSAKLASSTRSDIVSDWSSSPKPLASKQTSKSKVESSSKSNAVSRTLPSPVSLKTRTETVSVEIPIISSKSQSASRKPAVLMPVSPVIQSPPVSTPLPAKTVVPSSELSTKPSRRVSKSKDKTQRDPNSLPCKDRLFDADRHCGVWIEDIGRQCTHSLTCKIHSLTLRRAVSGRSRPFDQLLSDHRSSKDQVVRRRTSEKAVTAVDKVDRTVDKSNSLKLSAMMESEPIDTPPPDYDDTSSQLETDLRESVTLPAEEPSLPPSPPSWRSAWRARCVLLRSARLFSILTPSRLAPKKDDSLTKPEKLLIFPTVEKISIPEEMAPASSDDEDEIDMGSVESQTVIESGLCRHHPRPLAVNGFGSLSIAGSGVHLFNRREVMCRWAVNAAVDHSLPRRSVSKKVDQDSSAISTTVPYCDRYNFVCQTNPLFNRLSVQTTMFSSSQLHPLSPTKQQPTSLNAPRLKSSLLSVSNNIRRDLASSCAISPVSGSSNAADTLWRSSFVCISSLTSQQENLNRTPWAMTESELPSSSSCAVFHSPVTSSSSFDSSRLMSILASPPSKEVGSLDQLIESLNSPVSSESCTQSIPASKSVVNHASRSPASYLTKTAVCGAFEMVVNTASKTTDSNDKDSDDFRRIPSTLNGRVQSLPVRKSIANDGNSSDKNKKVLQPVSDGSSDSSFFYDRTKLEAGERSAIVTDNKLSESSVFTDNYSVSKNVVTNVPNRRLSNDPKPPRDRSLQRLVPVEKSSSNMKVKSLNKVPVSKSPDRRLSSEDWSLLLEKSQNSEKRRDLVDLCEKNPIDQKSRSSDHRLQPSSSLPNNQFKSKDSPLVTSRTIDSSRAAGASRASDWTMQNDKHSVKSTTLSSTSKISASSEQLSSIGSSLDKLAKKHSSKNDSSSSNRRPSLEKMSPHVPSSSTTSALLTNGVVKSYNNSMAHTTSSKDHWIPEVAANSKLKTGSNLSTSMSTSSSDKTTLDSTNRSAVKNYVASQNHHVTSSNKTHHRSSDTKLLQPTSHSSHRSSSSDAKPLQPPPKHKSPADVKLPQPPQKRHKSSSSSKGRDVL